MVSFYIDSCIYLNLWNKEGNETFGIPYWKIALDFFDKYQDSTFYFSNFILKELKYVMKEKDFIVKKYLFYKGNFIKIRLSKTEINFARELESELNYEISFYDIIHMLLAKKSNSILITRDKKLLQACKKCNIPSNKPEYFL